MKLAYPLLPILLGFEIDLDLDRLLNLRPTGDLERLWETIRLPLDFDLLFVLLSFFLTGVFERDLRDFDRTVFFFLAGFSMNS